MLQLPKHLAFNLQIIWRAQRTNTTKKLITNTVFLNHHITYLKIRTLSKYAQINKISATIIYTLSIIFK